MSRLTIRLLGGLEIIESRQGETTVLSKKAQGLVAYLALQRGRRQSREKLAALFWQNSPEKQARTNLRQALSSIRKALNSDKANYLVTDGELVSLSDHNINLDVTLLERLVAEAAPKSLKQAAAIYKGDFLDGFSLKEDSFEAWARAERERLRHLASEALTKLIAHCDEIGDTERCVETAARLLILDPLREAAHRILMRAYAAQGRHTSALKQFEDCRDILKRELGVEPEPKTVALYRNIRKQRAGMPGDAIETPPQPEAMVPPLPDGPSVAVLPFENKSSDPDQSYFADGLSENIITTLSKIPSLLVVAHNSTFTYKGQAVDVNQVSREQGVRYVLEGSVRKAGNRVRVTAQLIDATTGHHLWAERYDRDIEDIFAVQDEITREVVVALDVRLREGEQARIWSGGTKNVDAWECVRLGMAALNRITPEGRIEAERLFKMAIDLDPSYPMGWAAFGWFYFHDADIGSRYKSEAEREDIYASAMACGQKALDLDPSCADAYAMLGLCHLSKRQYDEAIAMSEKAVALAPNHAENLATTAATLNKVGQPERALELIRRAMRLCPVYPAWYLFVLGTACRLLDRKESAIEAFNAALERNADQLSIQVGLASTLGELGREEDAKKTVSEILRLKPDFSSKAYSEELSYNDPAELARFENGLREAGLPE